MRERRTYFISAPRPLTSDDMATLLQPVRVPTITTERIRASHHMIAMLVAMGLRTREIAERTGYTAVRINTLVRSPAFQELIATKRAMVEADLAEEARDIISLDRAAYAMAVRQRFDALAEADESGEPIPLRLLNAICTDGADRYGVPKKAANLNLNADFAAELEKALARAAMPTGPIPASRRN